jgi:hypothetical protein
MSENPYRPPGKDIVHPSLLEEVKELWKLPLVLGALWAVWATWMLIVQAMMSALHWLAS